MDYEWQPTDRALPQGILFSDRLFVADTTLPYRLLSLASIYIAYADVYDTNQVTFAAKGGTGRLASKNNGIQSSRAISCNTEIQSNFRFWNKTGAIKQTIQDCEESVPSPAHLGRHVPSRESFELGLRRISAEHAQPGRFRGGRPGIAV